jgi:hypothetical protein
MADYTITVGPSARDYTTLQDAWNSLPSTIDAADTYYISVDAGSYSGIDDASNLKTINGRVHILPAAGDAWYENINLASDALAFLGTRGVVITGSVYLKSVVQVHGNVTFDGLQIEATGYDGALQIEDSGWIVDRCILIASGSAERPFRATGNCGGSLQNSLIVSNTSNSNNYGIYIRDTNSASVNINNNILICVGGGGGAWLHGNYGGDSIAKNNIIFGFAAATASRVSSSSANNLTDLSSLPGTGNIVSQTISDHIESISTYDARIKSWSSALAGGVDTGLTYDITNQPRSVPLSIGAQEDAAGADAYGFTDQTGAALSTLTTSDTITVTGIDASTPISITGGEYSINGGAYTSASGNVVVNDTVTLRVTSSASYSTAVNVALDIGGVQDTWTVTTMAQPVGTLTLPAMKNNTGTVNASDTGITVDVYSVSTGDLVERFTGETTDASGICAVSSVNIIAATDYTVVVRRSNDAIGVAEITAT